jgi:P-type Cu+ transporter
MNMGRMVARSVMLGIAGMAILLGVYFLVLTVVSGWEFTLIQFFDFWYFIITLAGGFGIQLGL